MPKVSQLMQVGISAQQAKQIMDNNDGWVQPFTRVNSIYGDEVWIYASATTATIPSGTRWYVGDKVRLKQGGAFKYFYVVNATSSLITLDGGNTYTLANATITDLEFSRSECPSNFPVFSWTPTYTTDGITWNNKVTHWAKYFRSSTKVFCNIAVTGTSAAPASKYLRFTLPVTASATAQAVGGAYINDNTVILGASLSPASTTVMQVARYDDGLLAILGNNLGLGCNFWYEAA